LLATIKNALRFMHLDVIFFYINWLVQLLALGIICWMVLKALHSPELFRGINSKLQLVKHMIKSEQHVTKSNNEDSEEIRSLKTYMEMEEPYLNPNLTIYKLSDQLQVPIKQLSLLINHDMNQHFFDFVNSYRIKKAMTLLQDPDKKDITVLEILYDVGFNSKSSFNTAFRKYTNLTPTQFRKRALNDL
jgi:AraC-like DNA-binding protein